KPKHVVPDNLPVELRSGKVEPDGLDRSKVIIHEHSFGGASAQRFDSVSTAPGEEVENAGADHQVAQGRKNRAPNNIHGRTKIVRRNSQRYTASGPCNDSHGLSINSAIGDSSSYSSSSFVLENPDV